MSELNQSQADCASQASQQKLTNFFTQREPSIAQTQHTPESSPILLPRPRPFGFKTPTQVPQNEYKSMADVQNQVGEEGQLTKPRKTATHMRSSVVGKVHSKSTQRSKPRSVNSKNFTFC
jgi:hypothetical protein